MKYYAINEESARRANDMNSFSEYRTGSQTEEYRRQVDEAYMIGEERKAKYPEESDRVDYLCDLYARKLAIWYNDYLRNECACPSILVSGGGNFPVRKKEKQNSRRDTLSAEYEKIQKIVDRIRSCGTDAIKSNDERAIEKLELKIEKLTESQEFMKAVNAYYKKNQTLDGCPVMTEEQIEEAKAQMASGWHIYDKPFPPYALSNNNANIRRYKERLESLRKVKEAGTQEQSSDIEGLKVVENTEAMRIQLIFDGKPDEETRNLLKSNGFKWSPRYTAWQRMLNENGKYAARRVLEKLRATA